MVPALYRGDQGEPPPPRDSPPVLRGSLRNPGDGGSLPGSCSEIWALTQSVIILDTDFLSAFLKIDRLSLVREFYAAEALLVPPAVYREVSCTQLVEALADLSWIRVETPEGRWASLLP